MWILLIDQNRAARPATLEKSLQREGHVIKAPKTLFQAQSLVLSEAFDLVLLFQSDLFQDVEDVVGSLRDSGVLTPILVVLQTTDASHRVQLLDLGADDVISLPFECSELTARIRALGRRTVLPQLNPDGAPVAGIQVDFDRHTLTSGEGQEERLRSKEFQLLELFLSRPNKLLSRSVIAERVWGTMEDVSDDAINMTISSLRRKLKTTQGVDRAASARIQTIRGYGYIFSNA